MSVLVSKINKNDPVYMATQTIMEEYTKLLHRLGDMEDENRYLKESLAKFQRDHSSCHIDPLLDEKTSFMPKPADESYRDDIKFTSGDNTTISAFDTSSKRTTPPSVGTKNRAQTCTSTPLRSISNKENAFKAADSDAALNTKNNDNTSNAPLPKDKWLSVSNKNSESLLQKFKTPHKKTAPEKKALATDNDEFQFFDETNTIPPSIEVLSRTRCKLSLLSRFKQSKLHFSKLSRPKSAPQNKKLRLQANEETYCEGLSATDNDIIFSDDENTDAAEKHNIIEDKHPLALDDETYCEGLSMPDSRIRISRDLLKPDDPTNGRTSWLPVKLNKSNVLDMTSDIDDVVLVPDSISTQDIFQEMDEAVSKQSPPKQIPQKTDNCDEEKSSPKQLPRKLSKQSPLKPMVPAKSNNPKIGCEECEEYYKLMGPSAVRYGKDGKVHMCSKQRRNFGIPDTPPGFWNPKIPNTPESQRVPPEIVYRTKKKPSKYLY